MPRLSESMTEGRLLRWCVEPGARVSAGDVVAEVEADKANMEIEATGDGVIGELLARPGDTVAVGSALMTVDEDVAAAGETADGRAARGTVAGPAGASDLVPDETPTSGETPTPAEISPVAARLAAELGIDLAKVPGTGPGGKILREDVANYTYARRKAGDPVLAGLDDGPSLADDGLDRTMPSAEVVDMSEVVPSAGGGEGGRAAGGWLRMAIDLSALRGAARGVARDDRGPFRARLLARAAALAVARAGMAPATTVAVRTLPREGGLLSMIVPATRIAAVGGGDSGPGGAGGAGGPAAEDIAVGGGVALVVWDLAGTQVEGAGLPSPSGGFVFCLTRKDSGTRGGGAGDGAAGTRAAVTVSFGGQGDEAFAVAAAVAKEFVRLVENPVLTVLA